MPGLDLQRYGAVIFDLDGTLYDGRRLRLRMGLELLATCLRSPSKLAEARLLQAFRRERERLAEEEAEGIRVAQYDRPAARFGIAPERLRSLVGEWIEERPLRHLPACRHPGLRELFSSLAANGVSVAVLSDYPVERKLAALGLAADVTVSGVDPEVDRLKPHPAGLLHTLDLLGRDRSECLFVGDRDDRDGEIARRVGMEYAILSRRPQGEHEFRGYGASGLLP